RVEPCPKVLSRAPVPPPPRAASPSTMSEPSKPLLCERCLLERHPEFVLDASVLGVDLSPKPLGWHRCEDCGVAYQGERKPYGTPQLCPQCIRKAKGCLHCKGLGGAHEPHCSRAMGRPAPCEHCFRPVIPDVVWRRCRGVV